MKSGIPKDILIVTSLTALAILVHGYHFAIEDAAIYFASIKKSMDPSLYPFNSEFFLSQTGPMLFDVAVARLAAIMPFSLKWTALLLHVTSLFLVIYGCLALSRRVFVDRAAQWSAIILVTAVLTIPVSGTRLYLVDQYLHPRTFATALTLFAAAGVLRGKILLPALLMVLCAPIHPQMTAYSVFFLLFLGVRQPAFTPQVSMAVALPFADLLDPAPPAWQEAMKTRTHHFLRNWTWYEWIGIVAPLLMLALFAEIGKRNPNPRVEHITRRTIAFSVFFFILAAAVSQSPELVRFATFQPMRSLLMVYLIMFLIGGGLLGQYVLKNHPVRWILFFVPVCIVMFAAQQPLFEGSKHIEIPGAVHYNKWVDAFEWARDHTPKDAIFALDPYYMLRDGQDHHGFRAYSERSMVADRMKDSGVSSLFPKISTTWLDQVRDLDGWESFTEADFSRLAKKYGVSWVVLERTHPAAGSLDCPYRNEAVCVCKVK